VRQAAKGGACPDAGLSGCQRSSAINRRPRSPFARGDGDLPLLKAFKRANILAPKSPESGECRLNWRARIQVKINTECAEFHGVWNYTVSPNAHPPNRAFIS
jgi:hypothetical protein